jgi:hypothetical protein
MKRSRLKKSVIKGADGKFRIYTSTPFGAGLIEQVKGTRAYSSHETAMKKMKKV